MRGLALEILFSSLPFLIEGVNGLDATPVLKGRQDQTPTFNSSSPTSSPFLLLRNFGSSLTACTPVNVTWAYAGPPLPLDLIATNIGVIPPSSQVSRANTFTDGQVLAVPSGASPSQPTQVSVTQGILPQASAVSWNVNVPAGWYQIVASFDSIFEDQTDPFLVQLGTDTSCLPGVTPTSATSMTSSSSVSSSSASSSSASISTPIGATITPESTLRKDSQVGVIVGVVAGAVVFLIIVLMAYLWLRKRKNALDRPIGGQSGGAKLSRGWGGLGSLNSHSERPERRNHASRDLTSATGHHFTKSGRGGTGFAERDQNRSNISTPFSPSAEKLASSPVPYTNPFDDAEGGLALATLPISSSRTSFQQLGSSSPHLHIPSEDDFFLYPNEPHSTRERTSSVDVHLHSSYSSSPPVDIEMARSYSASSSTRSPSTDLSHQLQKKANRQSTGSQSNVARRMPRKPVPAYDPSLPGSSNLTPDAPNLLPYVPSPVPSPIPSPATPTTPTASFGSTAYGHYSKKLQSNSDGPGLVHKSSFGPGGVEGKPVHYLIPDMPPPNKS